ncbi:MAG: hypothetical protein KDB21_08305, partial [Acidimicrobiales bacterium]|nr:hypothetical protein [Acidimicrobiales bacterium]
LVELQTSNLVAAIDEGEVDLGLLATPVDTGPLHVEELAFEPFELAVQADHPLSERPSVSVSVLRELPVLLLEHGHCLHDHARAACSIAGHPAQTVVRSASLATLTQMVAAGMGVTLLPISAVGVEARAGTGVRTVAFDPPPPGRTVALVWRPTDPRHSHFARIAQVIAGRGDPREAGVDARSSGRT